ncbi:MAG: glutamyl-tRNA reductase, partial [Gammaproteobacteria bacterium SG8_11]
MSILAFGINHKTAPVDIREKVAFQPAQMIDALRDLTARPHVKEAAIVSTCNRTELYCGLDQQNHEIITDWLSRYHKLSTDDIVPYIYAHPDQFAVRHALRVASGLDSLVLGEPQILGQMKDAYSTASSAGTLG